MMLKPDTRITLDEFIVLAAMRRGLYHKWLHLWRAAFYERPVIYTWKALLSRTRPIWQAGDNDESCKPAPPGSR